MLRIFKNWLQAALWPAIFLGITAYFVSNAIHGRSGLQAQQVQRAQLAQANLAFAAVDAQRAQWETRIADLSDQSVGPDMLDEQARKVLNLANPGDLVVDLPSAPAPTH